MNPAYSTDPNALEPMTVIQVIDRTFRIYRDHFIAFIGMVAIITVPLTLIDYVLTSDTAASLTQAQAATVGFDIPRGVWLGLILSIIMLIIQSIVVNGLITHISSEYHLGRKIGIGEAFSEARGRLWPLTLALLLIGVIFIGSMILLGVVSALCAVALILFPIIAYLVMTVYFYIVPVMILERVNVNAGISRAMYLGKQRFWPTIGLFLLIYIMIVLISTIISVVLSLVTRGVSQTGFYSGTDLVSTLAEMVVNIFVTPILPIALTIMYYDIRVRIEGLDFALASLDKANPRPFDLESPQPSQRFITGKDIRNIVLLVVGFAALFLVLGVLGAGLGSLLIR